jgi:type VI secretion system protein ImpA
MASANRLPLESLLAPIAGDNPAGVDLRADTSPTSTYYKLKDARFGARAQERDLDAAAEVTELLPEWRTILDLAPKVIAEQSKDLEVTAWLIEALIRRYGFGGLRDGFLLARGLVENFWEHLYPLPDEEGVPTKVAPLTALNGEGADGTLIQPIRKVHLTEGMDPGPFAAWHYEQARNLAGVTGEEAREWHLSAGAVTMDQIKASQKATTPKFFIDLVDDLKQCQEAFAALTAALDKACGADAPPSSSIRDGLEAALVIAMDLGRDALATRQTGGAQPSADGAGAAAPTGRGIAGGDLGSREDAFSTLLRVAEFFRHSEPHSPVSYTLEELVRRGRMSLPDLLNELINDPTQRRSYYVVAGMKPPEEPQSQQ